MKALIVSLESFQKGMNMITEALKKTFTRLEPLLKNAMDIIDGIIDALADALTPVLAIIIAIANGITKIIFQLLKPLFSIIEKIAYILIDIYNEILVPISGVIAEILNVIIRFINDLTGLGLDEFEAFEKIVIATEELTEEITKQQETLKKKYERMQDAVKEQLDSQLAALKSQYELGLISRQQYEQQAEKYASDADEKIYAIEQEMNEKLGDIKNNTKDTVDATEKTSEEATKTSSKLGDINLNFGNITEAVNRINDLIISTTTQMIQDITSSFTSVTSALTTSITSTISGVTSSITSLNSAITDSIVQIIGATTKFATGLIPGLGGGSDDSDSVGDNIANVLTGGLWGGIKNLFGWDVGSWSIPEDQMAVVHQGEIIVPRTFSEGIRRGELSLSSNGNVSKSESPLYVTVNVGGSVVTENQLIDSVYDGIRKGINSKRYSPLGAA